MTTDSSAGLARWNSLRRSIISAQFVADRFQIVHEAARQMLMRFESLNILSPAQVHSGTPGRPVRWWAADELLAAVTRWS
jgi:hypothetical protein